MMTPRDIVLANLNHTGSPRPGMTFDGDRVNDMLGVGIGASQNYTRKRWTEGAKEYYDDEWGNLWVRFVGGCANGEVVTAALPSWDGLDALKMPDYEDSSRYESMKETFAQPTDKFKLAHIGGGIFDNARYLRTMEV